MYYIAATMMTFLNSSLLSFCFEIFKPIVIENINPQNTVWYRVCRVILKDFRKLSSYRFSDCWFDQGHLLQTARVNRQNITFMSES